jgi:NhaP-type Na+/H+ and K+/H+ antiporter
MNYMIGFMAACMLLGLWVKPKKNLAYVVAGLAVLLVVFFLVKPDHM